MVDAKRLQVCAQMNQTPAAIIADAARNIRIDGDTLTGRYAVNGDPDIFNDTGKLVPEHNRWSRARSSLHNVDIRTAHAACLNFYKHFIRQKRP
jgi:hypothetical protein